MKKVSSRREFINRAAGALGVAAVAVTSIGGSALAADDQSPEQAAAVPTASSIPVVNARKFNREFLVVAAARESRDSVVIVFYGRNKELYDRVKAGAERATASGYPVKGILVANGDDSIELFADGQKISTSTNPVHAGMEIATASAIADAYRDVIIPRRKQQAQLLETPSLVAN